MHETVVDEVGAYLDPSRDKVVIGNWQDAQLLSGRWFDVVIADYLLGSVDFYSPHFQAGMVRRLSGTVRPGGWLAIMGKEPEELTTKDPVSKLVLEVDALRDASMIFGQQRPYREMPMWWVRERLQAIGLRVWQTKPFPRRLTATKVQRQLAWAEEEIGKIPHNSLQSSLRDYLTELRARVAASAALRKGHVFGQDYAILAQRRQD